MLQSIRDRTTGWLAVTIVALLCIPFAFWGINYYFSGGSEPVVATVNGEEITISQFQQTYTNYRTQMQSMLGRNLGPEDDALLKQEILQRLVESELLNQQAHTAGLYISDEQVRQTIMSIEQFRSDSGFNRDYYEQTVLQLGMSPAVYEQQMRLDMMAEQLQSAVIESEFSTRAEAEQAASLDNQQRDISYVIIPAGRFADSIELTDEEIEAYYQQNRERYTRPEAVRIAYVELRLEDLAETMSVTEEDLLVHYDENKAQYDQEDQRKVTQILFKADEDSDDEQRAASKTKAAEATQQLDAGSTFEELISNYSENPDTAILISEFGFMARGELPEAVDAKAFSMEVGDVSEVIESDKGFHIIKLLDQKGGEKNTFENNRDQVEQDYRRNLAEEQFFELADQLGALAYEHPDSLVVAAEETDLEIMETDFFTRDGSDEGLTADARVVDAGFSDDVLVEGLNSELLELSDRHLLVLRVLEHRERARMPLEEVREDVISDLRLERSAEQAMATGKQVISALQAGESMSDVATREAIEWQSETGIKRDDISINRAVLREAFRMPQPAGDAPVVDGVALGTGDYAVIIVEAAHQPEADSIKGKTIDDTLGQLEIARAAGAWAQYMEQLKAEADTRLFRDRL